MKNELVKEILKGLVKHFLDMVVLIYIRNQCLLSGYAIMELVQSRFEFMVSSGTIYSLLYALERRGLVKGEPADGKKCMH